MRQWRPAPRPTSTHRCSPCRICFPAALSPMATAFGRPSLPTLDADPALFCTLPLPTTLTAIQGTCASGKYTSIGKISSVGCPVTTLAQLRRSTDTGRLTYPVD